MEKFNNQYRIPSARANWHDYNGGVYFVTICTKNRVHYFGDCRDAARHVSTGAIVRHVSTGATARHVSTNPIRDNIRPVCLP